jgi:hypothetical protein
VSKVKATKPIRIKTDKDLWVTGKAVDTYRRELLTEQGGLCAVLQESMTTPCLDHDHYDGKCRGVIGFELNMFEGAVQKLWAKHLEGKTEVSFSEALRRLADYLEQDHSRHPFHGEILADLKKALKRRTKETIARNGVDHLGIVISEDLDKGEMITIYVTEFVKKLEENYLYE